jgi:hypothetical protein
MTKYLLMQHYEGGAGCDRPMGDWAAADVRAHIDFQLALDAELTAAGELVDSQGLAYEATRVVSDGGTPATGPVAGRLLAGYRMIDVADERRALEIAARTSAAPGPGGVPIQQPIEVRPVMRAP